MYFYSDSEKLFLDFVTKYRDKSWMSPTKWTRWTAYNEDSGCRNTKFWMLIFCCLCCKKQWPSFYQKITTLIINDSKISKSLAMPSNLCCYNPCKYTWCGIFCVPDVRPNSQFSRSDSLPSLCGYRKMVCSHKEHPPGLNLSTPSDQPELSERAQEHQQGRRLTTPVVFKISSNLHTRAGTAPDESLILSHILPFPVS